MEFRKSPVMPLKLMSILHKNFSQFFLLHVKHFPTDVHGDT